MTSREPKQDRSRATRARLLSSTIDCLATQGWTATTVAVAAERAGVSRGAAQHHFPTREDLITAAIEHIHASRMAEIRAENSELPDTPERTETVVRRMVDYYTGPMFKAALQVWTAAAADETLKNRIVPLEANLGRLAHQVTIELLDADDADPATHRLVQATLDLARGLGLADVLTDDSGRRERIVGQWAATLDAALRKAASRKAALSKRASGSSGSRA